MQEDVHFDRKDCICARSSLELPLQDDTSTFIETPTEILSTQDRFFNPKKRRLSSSVEDEERVKRPRNLGDTLFRILEVLKHRGMLDEDDWNTDDLRPCMDLICNRLTKTKVVQIELKNIGPDEVMIVAIRSDDRNALVLVHVTPSEPKRNRVEVLREVFMQSFSKQSRHVPNLSLTPAVPMSSVRYEGGGVVKDSGGQMLSGLVKAAAGLAMPQSVQTVSSGAIPATTSTNTGPSSNEESSEFLGVTYPDELNDIMNLTGCRVPALSTG